MEILHKWREVRILEDELDRGQQLKTLLEKLILNEQIYSQNMERSSSFAVSQPVSRVSTPGPPSCHYDDEEGSPGGGGSGSGRRSRLASVQAQSRTESIFQSERPAGTHDPAPLFEMCPDGSVVRLRCPECGADRFKSLLGMINHCRINCGLQISNPDERIQRCGVPCAPEEVPPGYFTLNKSVSQVRRDREIAQIRAGVQAPIIDPHRRAVIREFSETDTTMRLPSEAKGAKRGRDGAALPSSIASHQADVEALESRYYFRKRIIIGNFARSLDIDLSEAEAAEKQVQTHEWRLFLKPFDAHDDIGSYIRAVRFHLHPSYAPNDSLTVSQAPFELAMTGWGEFPARLEVVFRDPKNKPVEFVHFLRLRPCHSKTFYLMSEQAYDLELDKKSAGRPLPGAEKEAVVPRYPVDDGLAMASRFFPLFGTPPKQAHVALPAYNKAVSYAEFMKLSPFDQQALEKERAVALQRHVLPAHPDLTLEYVLEWCRRNGMTPVGPHGAEAGEPAEADQEARGPGISEDELRALQYCRYCGLAHFPQDKFDVLQKNCSMRPRKLHLSSRSTATELISRFPQTAEPAPETKKPRIIEQLVADPAERPQSQWAAEAQWASDAVAQLDLPAYQPREDTCDALVGATRQFLRDLLAEAVAKMPDTIERAVGRPILLTPLHLYQAVTGVTPISATATKERVEEQTKAQAASAEPSRFDFLTNSFMAGS